MAPTGVWTLAGAAQRLAKPSPPEHAEAAWRAALAQEEAERGADARRAAEDGAAKLAAALGELRALCRRAAVPL
jgi:predicted HAD superfamily Cof-like phosphohydrolase